MKYDIIWLIIYEQTKLKRDKSPKKSIKIKSPKNFTGIRSDQDTYRMCSSYLIEE